MTKHKILTLFTVTNQLTNTILLGYKKRGFGAGMYNGFGGKVESGESIEAGAQRELLEECGLAPIDYYKCGIIKCMYKDTDTLMV